MQLQRVHNSTRSLLLATALVVVGGLAQAADAAPPPRGWETAATAPVGAAEPLLPADACAQVIVYVVRGSGEAPQTGDAVKPYDPSNPTAGYGATWDAFDPLDPETDGSSIDADRVLDVTDDGSPTVDTGTPFLYDLTQKIHERVGGQTRLSWSPVRYPAIPVPTGGLPEQGLWLLRGYPASVTSGIRELHRTLKRQWESCGSRTRYVLAGYSQGADVVNSYLRGKVIVGSSTFGIATAREYLAPTAEIARQIAAVELIADPNHDPRDAESYSDEDPRLAQKGGQYGFRIGIPDAIAAVTDSFCIAGDPVCGQGTTVHPERTEGDGIHTDGYRNFIDHPVQCHVGDRIVADESAVTCAADRAVHRLGLRNLVVDPLDDAASAPGTTGRDVAFIIDTSGSMQDDIDSALSFARTQADRIVALDGRVALVQYRDHVDDVPAEIVVPFTSDPSVFQNGLSSLYAEGGGDEPEGLLHALMMAMDGLEWEFGASKAAVILTDAGFHEPDLSGGETLPLVERRSLEIDPVNMFPVVDLVQGYRDLAARTSGEVIVKSGIDTEVALTSALDNIAERPQAVLSNVAYYTAPDRDVHFDASRSSAVSGVIVEYRWDVDGDGFVDEVTAEPVLNHRFPNGYHGVMQVLVVDEAGRSANASASVQVDQGPQRGLVPRVAGASSMEASADRVGDHADLEVSWTTGSAAPAKWIVTVDGDPVGVVDGAQSSLSAAVTRPGRAWEVSLVPMDADGNLGPAYEATLDPLPLPRAWHDRPEVWLAAVVGGVLAFLGLGWLLLRRRPRRWGAA